MTVFSSIIRTQNTPPFFPTLLLTVSKRSSFSTMQSWISYRDEGKLHFQREEYQQALVAWQNALHEDLACPASERQVILSNIVACRLKIGGEEMARAAVGDAKKVS
jgi:5-methylthioribose kinase